MDKEIPLKAMEDGASDILAYIEECEQQKQPTLPLTFYKALAQLSLAQAQEGVPAEKIEFSAAELRAQMEKHF